MIPQHDTVIASLVEQLPSGGRLAVTGLRDPERWPEWLLRLGTWLNRPFSVSNSYWHHRPGESVGAHTSDTIDTDILGGGRLPLDRQGVRLTARWPCAASAERGRHDREQSEADQQGGRRPLVSSASCALAIMSSNAATAKIPTVE